MRRRVACFLSGLGMLVSCCTSLRSLDVATKGCVADGLGHGHVLHCVCAAKFAAARLDVGLARRFDFTVHHLRAQARDTGGGFGLHPGIAPGLVVKRLRGVIKE